MGTDLNIDRTKNFVGDYLRKKPLLAEKMEAYNQAAAATSAPIFRFLDISITNICNLACEHCYAFGYRKYEDLPLEYWEKGIREARELGAFMFSIQGGEPTTVMDRLETIISYIEPSENYVSIITNGFRMKRSTLEQLKDWGVDKITVSLESVINEEHDKGRGREGCCEDAKRTIFMARELGLAVSISSGITHQRIASGSFDKLVEFCREHNIRAEVQPAVPVGNYTANWDVMCTSEDSAYIKKVSDESTAPDSDLYLISRDIYPRQSRSGCGAGKLSLTINSNGEIFPCPFIQISFGNLRNTTLAEALAKARDISYLKTFWPVCLAAEDKPFIEKYLVPAAETVMVGAPYRTVEQVFGVGSGKN